ncbi:hypothetical protein B0T10DRAFT_402453, partial [Thelonectria olida]
NMEKSNFQQCTGTFRASQSRIKRKRPVVSCSACRRRKAKCDRKQPCSGCDQRGEGDLCDFRASPSHSRLEVQNQLDRIERAQHPHLDSQMSVQWAGLMQGIHDIRRALDASSNNPDSRLAHPEQPDLVFGSMPPTTTKAVLTALPVRQVADRLIAAYFNSKYVAPPILHTHQFRRQYEAFWEAPESCDILWISILLSTLSIGSMVASAKGLFSSSGKTLPDPKTYITLSARCLVAGQYLTAKAFSVEALVMHAHSRYIHGSDSVPVLSAICGLTVRLAQGQGFHRDLGLHPATATPFQIEMRRRVWFMIQYYDLLFALEQGIPPLIHGDTFDTDHPTNLADDDFDEDSIGLSPRPVTDPQPVLACIYQSRLLPILRRIMRHSCLASSYTRSDTMLLGSELDQWHTSIPPCLKVRPIQSTSFTDPNYTVMNRVMLELLYNMSISTLYRPFLQSKLNRQALCESSLDVCRRTALKSVYMYLEVHQELQLGGRFHEDRYMASNMRLQDFLIAAMVVPLEFSGCPNLPHEEGIDQAQMLRKAYEIWLRRKKESKIDSDASRAFEVLLGQIEATEKSSDSLRAELKGHRRLQYDASQLASHSQFDLTSDEAAFTMASSSTTSIPQTMTSLVLPAFNQPLVFEKTPIPPETAPGSVLVQILSTALRPHHRLGFTRKSFLSFPIPYTPGNSGIARVISVGPDAASLKPGQLVFVNGFLAARDDPEGTQVLLGLHDGGGPEGQAKLFAAWKGLWRDIGIVPMENCLALNEKILVDDMGYSFGDLNYIERLSVAYGGVSAAQLHAGQTVIVAPATGHFSGAVAELAAQIGCSVIALSRSASKLIPLTSRHPRITGLELTGDEGNDIAAIMALCPSGADAFIDVSPPEATASPHHLAVGVKAVRSGATVVFLGAMGDVKVSYVGLMARSITLKGQFMYSRAELARLTKMIETGVVKLGEDAGHELVNGGYPLEDWEAAVAEAEGAVKWGQQVVFLPKKN